jgi:hypothetical protein
VSGGAGGRKRKSDLEAKRFLQIYYRFLLTRSGNIQYSISYIRFMHFHLLGYETMRSWSVHKEHTAYIFKIKKS